MKTLRENAEYINKVGDMTLKEVRTEVSRLNSINADNNGKGIREPQNYEDLATCALTLSNFFIFHKVDESKTYKELKNGK